MHIKQFKYNSTVFNKIFWCLYVRCNYIALEYVTFIKNQSCYLKCNNLNY
jgi:hypothetical protein